MLTDEDIQKIIAAQKFVFATKEEFEVFRNEMRTNFSDLLTSVDAYAKKADTFMQELVMLGRKVDRLESWILQIAKKVDVQLT